MLRYPYYDQRGVGKNVYGYGGQTLYKYDTKQHVTVLPDRPELPMLYHSHLWPSYQGFKRGTEPWRDYRTIRDFWKTSAEQVAATGRKL